MGEFQKKVEELLTKLDAEIAFVKTMAEEITQLREENLYLKTGVGGIIEILVDQDRSEAAKLAHCLNKAKKVLRLGEPKE
jgi:hypothetical protein